MVCMVLFRDAESEAESLLILKDSASLVLFCFGSVIKEGPHSQHYKIKFPKKF